MRQKEKKEKKREVNDEKGQRRRENEDWFTSIHTF